MQQKQSYNETGSAALRPIDQTEPVDLPQCCGTGCAVCVLDYPELFSTGDHQAGNRIDSETVAMLEAIEQAQMQASQMIAETGELQ